MKNKNHLFLTILFLLTVLLVVVIGQNYKKQQHQQALVQQYDLMAASMRHQIETLIEEKKNATLAVAVALSQNNQLKTVLKASNHSSDAVLKKVAGNLGQVSDFKNVRVQVVNATGISLARSWTDKVGDDLSSIREDILDMIKHPRPMSVISVGHYDLTFKSMVPVFAASRYLGFVEVITHFNSIAEKIQQAGYQPLVLVAERYESQITKTFAGKHYVANLNARPDLVDRIARKGLSLFVKDDKPYVIDLEAGYLVVNQILYAPDKKPMATILMFKELKEIKNELLVAKTENVNLVMVIVIFALGLIFYLLGEKSQATYSTEVQGAGAIAIIFSIVFVALLAVSGHLVYSAYQDEKRAHMILHNRDFQRSYELIKRKYHAISETFLQLTISQPEVIHQMALAYKGRESKAQARKTLHTLLEPSYKKMKEYDLRQLHFHLNTNESFLRFHRPQKFGDDLTDVRETVSYVNRSHKPVSGFEEGRIFSGFRNVYPVMEQEQNGLTAKHLGSVEISYSPLSIAKDFSTLYEIPTDFIIKEAVVTQKVFASEQQNYQKCDLPGFLIDKEVQSFQKTLNQCMALKQGFKGRQAMIAERINEGRIFSVESDKGDSLLTFIPIHNPINDQVVAAFLFKQKNTEFQVLKTHYIVWFAVSLIIILLILLYLYKEVSSAQRFRLLSKKTQQILNAQSAIVIVTDGREIFDANEAFLNFFNEPSLAHFKQKHDCICDFFEFDDRVFHLKKIADHHQWVAHLLTLSYRERLVSMKDRYHRSRIFALSINTYLHNQHILTFSDITETMSEHFSLEKRAMHDPLTNAYNRDYFAQKIGAYEQVAQRQNRRLAFILFDIDHFKQVNDTFGHNVGDEVLVNLVKITKGQIRSDDILIRWGGEEFLVVIPVDALEQAEKVAETIRAEIEAYDFPVVGNMTCSFGVCLHLSGDDFKTTVKCTDDQLYVAKKAGRNRVCASR
ncbi:MAG: diguanylate cyclase [Hydrogenovibrio sp.]